MENEAFLSGHFPSFPTSLVIGATMWGWSSLLTFLAYILVIHETVENMCIIIQRDLLGKFVLY